VCSVRFFLKVIGITSFFVFAGLAHSAPFPRHFAVFDAPLLDPPTKICVLGDSGTGDENQVRVAQALEAEGCSQIRIVGDLIYPKGLKSADDPGFRSKFLEPFRGLIENLSQPGFFLALGNHDYLGRANVWRELAKRHPFLYFPHRYYAESYPASGICIATLDTSPFDNIRYFGKSFGQGAWLRRVEKAFRGCEFSVAFAHHPYLNGGHHGNARAFVKRFLRRNIVGKYDLFFAGHEHLLADEGQLRGTSLMISGAGAKTHGAAERPPAGDFSVAKLGYATLEFARNADRKIEATVRFKTVDDAGGVAHERRIVGEGIRRKDRI
jgi:hypothetical protein